MSDDNRSKRSKPRNESGIHGKHYERKVFALIALKCLFEEDIKDFWLLSNPADVNKFDDIILFTEHCNREKKLFMIQAKHKLKGKVRPIVAHKLDSDNKDLGLTKYQEAFFEIKKNEDFLNKHGVPKETDMFFTLFSNHQIDQEIINDNIGFDCNQDKYFKFIDSSSNPNAMLRITKKGKKYDQNFLDQFYFYTDQLNEESIDTEIENLLGINDEVAKIIINFFYSWVDPAQDYCIKLSKFDIKMKLLDILFADFQPPHSSEGMSKSMLINMINKFDVTVMAQKNSSIIIWKEILDEMQHFCDDVFIEFIAWGECVSKCVEKKLSGHFRNRYAYGKNITIRLVYILMVTQRKVPFFIETTNRFFDTFKSKFIHALNIYSIVLNTNDQELSFPDEISVFKKLSDDVEDLLYSDNSKQLTISFQGKTDIDLYALIRNHTEVKQSISVDNYIELLRKKCVIGETSKLPPYYINRQMQVPVLKKEVLGETELIFIIIQFTTHKKIKNYKHCNLLYALFQTNYKIFGKPYHIFTLPYQGQFNKHLRELIESILKDRIYYVLKYEDTDEGSFLLIHTNGNLEVLRPYLMYIPKSEMELIHIYQNIYSNVNVICNNAGMGKSMFLYFINSKSSPDDWVVHIDLKKYGDSIKNVETVEELITFFYRCQTENISETFHSFLKTLHNCLKHKIIWLIDDYEEVHDLRLLKLLKLAKKQGFTIWIVARPLLKLELENFFGVFSMELKEFNHEDQIMFIKKYLKQKEKNEGDIENILKAINNIRYLLEDSFIGICQQTMMITEIFLNYDKNWMEHEWHIHDIYEKFIQLKVSDNYGPHRQWYIRTISKLALKVFFKDKALKKVFDLEEFAEDVRIFESNYKKDFFIVEFGEDDVPIFSHRTYAEFLAARWLLHTLEKQVNRETPFNISDILRVLYLKELTGVRLFFDNMITQHLPLHSAIINKEENKIVKFIDEPSYFSKTDPLGRSIFHLLSGHGRYFDIGITTHMKNMLRNVDVHSQVKYDGEDILLEPVESVKSVKSEEEHANIIRFMSKLPFPKRIIEIIKKDTLLKLDCSDYALLSGSLLELDALLNIRCLISNSPLSLPEETKYFLLFHCIQNKYKNILCTLDNIQGLHNVKIGHSKMSLLHLAVYSKNKEAIKKLIEKQSLNDWGVDNEGNTVLHVACDQKNDSMLEYVFSLVHVDPAFINRKNLKGQSHLYFLARRGHKKWIKKLIETFPEIDIDSECCNGNTPFIMSIIFNKLGAARILRSSGANLNHSNINNMTALHYSVSKRLLECVKKLIRWGADINQKDNYGITPLMKASSWGYKNIALLLLGNKAEVNLSDKNLWSALHHAVKRNHIEIIELLLKYKANVNCVNKKRECPLMIACKYNFPKAVKLLLSENITYGKKCALKLSIQKEHKECMDLLFQAGFTL